MNRRALLPPDRANHLGARGARPWLGQRGVAECRVVARAAALAHQLARKSTLQLRYSRVILTEPIKEQMHRLVGYGMALEGLALSDPTSGFPTT
jgi:hypothetical protein